MASGCCGQPARRRQRPIPPKLPSNPKVQSGVRLLYLGAGWEILQGSASGLRYNVSEYRRPFTVQPDDAPTFLRRRDVILAP
jgi:hypothetical protein